MDNSARRANQDLPKPNPEDDYSIACTQSLLSGVAVEPSSGLTAADGQPRGRSRDILPAPDRRGPFGAGTQAVSDPEVMRESRQRKGKTMTERELGRSGLKVSAIGLGCMGMSEFYDPKQMDDAESIRVIHRYLDAGGNFLDTADMYGVGRNEVAGRQGDRRAAATRWCWRPSSATSAARAASSSASAATRSTSRSAATRASSGWASR